MKIEGPCLESLTHRLSETPDDFLKEPRIGNSGSVHVQAVIADLIRLINGTPDPSKLIGFTGKDSRLDRNRLATVLVISWLLSDEWFQQNQISLDAILGALQEISSQLSGQVGSRKFVNDPDRREELARMVLSRLGYRPAGETLAQAQDRLTSISSTERSRVLQASRAAEERARAIRAALAKKAAEESADKWTRE